MNKLVIMALLWFTVANTIAQTATEKINLPVPKFTTGNNPDYKNADFNDGQWKSIKTGMTWEEQGYRDYDGYAWYRFKFHLPASFLEKAYWKDSIQVWLGSIDDADEVYFNGTLIGKTGRFPEDRGGLVSRWEQARDYHVSAQSPFIRWGSDNVIAVKVYDGSGPGGMYNGVPYIRMMDMLAIRTDKYPVNVSQPDKLAKNIVLENKSSKPVEGSLAIQLADRASGKILSTGTYNIKLGAFSEQAQQFSFPYKAEMAELKYTFAEKTSGNIVASTTELIPYILTPKPPATLRVNGADVFGVRPGSPFLYRIPATGDKPMTYEVKDLPKGLTLDSKTGIITGVLENAGDYEIVLIAKNKKGKGQKNFTIKCGNLLALTPPMGWNSWNCWGVDVDEQKVKNSAQAMIDKGLLEHGWSYINIDDAWQDETRNSDGSIAVNKKFGDIKKLGDWLHNNGMRLGIYSSPGPRTCGGYLGSFQHEEQDAVTYANWGVDYLKYDWCSYEKEDTSLAAYKKPYRIMEKALKEQKRDIVYSLCQYGMREVWKWGAEVNGNCWRTTGDITDTWKSLRLIGFDHGLEKTSAYAQPGRWNDPDMLIVGYVGWSNSLRQSRLTYDEQYLHISLWSLMASPLLIGCDMSKLDDFTLNLLTNDEVIAINQDVLGKAAERVIKKDNYEVWIKPLKDGSMAIGIFNLADNFRDIPLDASSVNISPEAKVRDVWRQKDTGKFGEAFQAKVPPHGVVLITVRN